MLSNLLCREGYRVLAIGDGRTALSAYENHADEVSLVIFTLAFTELSDRHSPDSSPASKALCLYRVPLDVSPLDQTRLLPYPYSKKAILTALRELLPKGRAVARDTG